MIDGYVPDGIVTPNQGKLLPELQGYVQANVPGGSLVTLHKYLKILPPEFVNGYEVWNMHPADILHRPELKGLNPQKRNQSNLIGCTLHRARVELDCAGTEALELSVLRDPHTPEMEQYRALAMKLWTMFLSTKLSL